SSVVTPDVQFMTPFAHQARYLGPADPGPETYTPAPVTGIVNGPYYGNQVAAANGLALGPAAPIISGIGTDGTLFIGTPGTTLTTNNTAAAPIIGSTIAVTPTNAAAAVTPTTAGA